MTANTQPLFTATPVISCVTVVATATARSGVGAATLCVGGTNGTRLESVVATLMANTTEAVGFFLFVNNGVGDYLIGEVEFPIFTQAGDTEVRPQIDLLSGLWVDSNDRNLLLPAGYTLKVGVSASVSSEVQFVAMGGDY